MSENFNLQSYFGAKDLPDSRDYTHEEVFGEMASSVELPRRVMLDEAENLMQGSVGACTIVGGINASNETHRQAVKDFGIFTDWQSVWNIAKSKGASDAKGWYLQSAQQLLKDENITGGYVKIGASGSPQIEKMKYILAVEKKAIYSGVAIANWRETTDTHEFSLRTPTLAGHAFDIVGYDDDYRCKDGTIGAFFVRNSWEGGHFYFPYSCVNHLFTQYVNVYSDEVEKLLEAKKKRRTANLQKAFEVGIWNEERGDEVASAYEIRVMLNRALRVIDGGISADWRTFRSSYAHLFDEKIVRGKVRLWNEEQKFSMATDEEIALMFTRAVCRDGGVQELRLTRGDVAEVVGRDFL